MLKFYFSLLDIVFDFLLFATYLKVTTENKTVPMKNDSSILNNAGRNCTLVEENVDGYKFSCEVYSPIFASLTLVFIYLPSLNVLATLYGPRTAGAVGQIWGLVMLIFSIFF